MTINNEDIIVYMLKEAGITGRIFKILSKIDIDFNNLLSFDFENYLYERFTKELSEFPDEKDLNKLSKAFQMIKKNDSVLRKEAQNFFKNVLNCGISWTNVLRKDYPKRLMNIPDPPLILYYKGCLPKEDKPSVAIIGARECSMYGEKVAKMFARELSIEGVQIISGMARGIDGISQRNSIETGGSTFGILAFGVDEIYPKENEDIFNSIIENGGLISEFEPGTKPLRQYFPSRNRIISGLSDIVLVVEARKKSGTYITVTQALEQGRDVFAVPGRITDGLSDGCNSLISSGAGMALNSNVILDELRNKHFKTGGIKEAVSINENPYKNKYTLEDRILCLLYENELTLSALYQELSDYFTIEDLSVALVDLEALGKITKIGGRFVIRH